VVEAIPISVRLLRGAKILGALWRSGQKCKLGWNIDGTDPDLVLCRCENPTKFCAAKKQWFQLVLCERDPIPGLNGLALMMSGQEWDETGCGFRIGSLVVGTSKDSRMSMRDYHALSSDPESAEKIIRLLERFAGSKVEAVKQTV